VIVCGKSVCTAQRFHLQLIFAEHAFRKMLGTIPHICALSPAKQPEENNMRKVITSVIALAVLGIAAPIAATTSANAETVVIKKDRGHHYGWYKHERWHGWDRDRYHHHRGAKVIINR
jgi:hypothetical protein